MTFVIENTNSTYDMQRELRKIIFFFNYLPPTDLAHFFLALFSEHNNVDNIQMCYLVAICVIWMKNVYVNRDFLEFQKVGKTNE